MWLRAAAVSHALSGTLLSTGTKSPWGSVLSTAEIEEALQFLVFFAKRPVALSR